MGNFCLILKKKDCQRIWCTHNNRGSDDRSAEVLTISIIIIIIILTITMAISTTNTHTQNKQ